MQALLLYALGPDWFGRIPADLQSQWVYETAAMRAVQGDDLSENFTLLLDWSKTDGWDCLREVDGKVLGKILSGLRLRF
jgi:hypothetical protein